MWSDLLTIGLLVGLEALLSADNALVLAILVRHLPHERQNRALLYGLFGAFLFRFVAVLFAKWILQIWWLQGIGAVYLAYLTIDHFAASHAEKERRRSGVGRGFWKTVAVVELTDIAFAVDSIMVAVALSTKIWVVYIGGVLGTVAMRVAAGFVVRLLKRYPQLEGMAYVLIGWTAVKLGFATYENFRVAVQGLPREASLLPEWLFWSVLGVILIVGTVLALRHPHELPAEATEPEKSLTPQ